MHVGGLRRQRLRPREWCRQFFRKDRQLFCPVFNELGRVCSGRVGTPAGGRRRATEAEGPSLLCSIAAGWSCNTIAEGRGGDTV